VVNGAPDSIALVLADAKRQGEEFVWLLTDAGMIHVNATLPWEIKGVRASG
jgi:hypothetical protein